MKVGLIDVDSHNFPNLALMKLSSYHKSRGDGVEFVEFWGKYDLVYKSKIFNFTKDVEYGYFPDKEIVGGTGYDIDTKLPEYIEKQFPDYSLYPNYEYAVGFLTRGCPRNCPFCIVTQKEGNRSTQVAEIKDFWNGQKLIKILDPNLLACKDREKILRSLIGTGVYIDFTQGLDIRLVDENIIKLIKKLKIYLIHFAYDQMKNKKIIEKNLIKFVKNTGWDKHKIVVYVLVNYDTNFEEDIYRIEFLKRLKVFPFIMIYDKKHANMDYYVLQRYCNNPRFYNLEFKDYKVGNVWGKDILKRRIA